MSTLSGSLLAVIATAIAPLNSSALEALSNLQAPSDGLQSPGTGTAFARVFSTGQDSMLLDSVVLEHAWFEPAQMSWFAVKIYRVLYYPGSSTPDLALVGVLDQYAPPANATGIADGSTLVFYYPSEPLVLQHNSLYAVAAAQSAAGDNNGPVLAFTDSTEQTALPGWEMGQELVGLDLWGLELWLDPFQPGYLKFALNVEPVGPVNSPPDVSEAYATVSTVWPPNGKMVPFQIAGVTDDDEDAVSIQITAITQNEPVLSSGDNTAPDAIITGDNTATVRAERSGSQFARVYAVFFTASDGKPGGTVKGVTFIVVPHDESSGEEITANAATAGDYDSTARY